MNARHLRRSDIVHTLQSSGSELSESVGSSGRMAEFPGGPCLDETAFPLPRSGPAHEADHSQVPQPQKRASSTTTGCPVVEKFLTEDRLDTGRGATRRMRGGI